MSHIKLDDVCLDYIVKTGSESMKKSFVGMVSNLVKSSDKKDVSFKNTCYRALHNINLDIKDGDRVGILGRNGAGKSTLLRVLAKVYKPTLGELSVYGKISSVFDINLGTYPEATGYENIVNMSIMRGISSKEARSKFKEIEEFTELSGFLDHPVRTYSTGMQMKLAFAVALSTTADILLIDEIIGAGDMHFMEKATEKLGEQIERSNIMVLTSHSNEIIEKFCNKVIVLDKGKLIFEGSVAEGIAMYEN